MDKAVIEYRKRRQARLDAKNGVEPKRDAVGEFRKRRQERMDIRGEFNENDHPRGKDGKFVKGSGAISEKGRQYRKDPDGGGGGSSGWKDKVSKIKGVTIKKRSGFDVPEFDENTFTDNFEEKKAIAREAAKSLVPAVKKTLSTEVKEIKRPEVDESVRESLKKSVENVSEEEIDRALEEADGIYRYWEENEPKITDAVVGAVKGVGGSMFGLDNRLKFDKSLAKKMLGDSKDPKADCYGDIGKAAKAIKDGARYTAVFDSDNFAEGYQRVKDALGEMGIKEYRCKNFFTQYRDQDGKNDRIGEQKSVQCVFETPDGKLFELQFHTPESMAAKEVNHPTYKQKKEPPSENIEYNKPRSLFMRDTSSVVPDPKGVFEIEGHERGKTGYK